MVAEDVSLSLASMLRRNSYEFRYFALKLVLHFNSFLISSLGCAIDANRLYFTDTVGVSTNTIAS